MNEVYLMKEMARLQEILNYTIDPNWKESGYAWFRAVWRECAEFIDSFNWEWWKIKNNDIENAVIEAVDIFHFVLSWALEWLVDPEIFYARWYEGYKTELDKNPIEIAESIAKAALNKDLETSIIGMGVLCKKLNLDIERLAKIYFGKNTLNMFRKTKGYKRGTYSKLWNGKEDNKVMLDFIESLSIEDGIDQFCSDLTDKFEEYYYLATTYH